MKHLAALQCERVIPRGPGSQQPQKHPKKPGRKHLTPQTSVNLTESSTGTALTHGPKPGTVFQVASSQQNMEFMSCDPGLLKENRKIMKPNEHENVKRG